MIECAHSKPDGLKVCAACMPGEINRLYDALLKYGNHVDNCQQRGLLAPVPCTCGFRLAIACDRSRSESWE